MDSSPFHPIFLLVCAYEWFSSNVVIVVVGIVFNLVHLCFYNQKSASASGVDSAVYQDTWSSNGLI